MNNKSFNLDNKVDINNGIDDKFVYQLLVSSAKRKETFITYQNSTYVNCFFVKLLY